MDSSPAPPAHRRARRFAPPFPNTCRTIHTPTLPTELAIAASGDDAWCLKDVVVDGESLAWQLSIPVVLQSPPADDSSVCERVSCLVRQRVAWNLTKPGANCTVRPCANGGHCTAEGVCECPSSAWTGRFCEKRGCQNNCSSHGTCYAGKCACNEGWTDSDGNGDDCDQGTLPPVFDRSLPLEMAVDEGTPLEMRSSLESGTEPVTFVLPPGLHTTRGLALVGGNMLSWNDTVANDYPYWVRVTAVNAWGRDTITLKLSARMSYTTKVRLVGPTRYAGSQRIDFEGNSSKPWTTVTLWLRLRGMRRTWRAPTDSMGHFATSFLPTRSEAGVYTFGSKHPLAEIAPQMSPRRVS